MTALLLMNMSRHEEILTHRDYASPRPRSRRNIYINPIWKSKLLYWQWLPPAPILGALPRTNRRLTGGSDTWAEAQIITLLALAWHPVYEAKYTLMQTYIHMVLRSFWNSLLTNWITKFSIIMYIHYLLDMHCKYKTGDTSKLLHCTMSRRARGIQPGLLLVIYTCFCTFIFSLWCLTSASMWHPRASWQGDGQFSALT